MIPHTMLMFKKELCPSCKQRLAFDWNTKKEKCINLKCGRGEVSDDE